MPHNYSRVSESASAIHVMADGNVTACGRAGTRWVMDAASAYDGLLYAYYSHVCERCAARTVGAVPTYTDKLQAETDRVASKALDAAIDAESDEVPAGQVHMTYARDRVSGAHNGDRCTTCGRSAHRRNGSWQGHPFTSADDDAHATELASALNAEVTVTVTHAAPWIETRRAHGGYVLQADEAQGLPGEVTLYTFDQDRGRSSVLIITRDDALALAAQLTRAAGQA